MLIATCDLGAAMWGSLVPQQQLMVLQLEMCRGARLLFMIVRR